MKKVRLAAALGALALLPATVGTATAATPVAGFEEQTVVHGLDQALSMDWTPDGRMVVAEKPGVVKVVNPDGSVVRVLDISSHVNSYVDRGLTGIAVDAQYATNNFVYLLYTYDALDNDDGAAKSTRLTRIVLRPDNKVAKLNTTPETVILGTYPALKACPPGNSIDCIPADGVSHVGGSVRAAPDGTLYVGTGDAVFDAKNTPDPMRPLDETSMAGKILHVDRNGRGLPGHPFCPQNGTLTDACARIHAMGFRNPFRFSFASRGGLWLGDVGASRWEELDLVGAGGSYGWPCHEGNNHNLSMEDNPRCQPIYAAGRQTAAVWAYPHDYGACIIGGPEIRSSRFPADWQGDVIVGDLVSGRVDRVEVDATGKFVSAQPFASGWFGADLRLGPDGLVYSASFDTIRRFVPVSGNRPPDARASVTPIAGLAPFDAHFDGSGSSDPDGDALTYLWTFGDGMSSTQMSPSHTYIADGRYTARLTVTDPSGATSSAEVTVVVGTTPPTVTFTKPAAGFRYIDGVPVDLEVSATDREDGTLPAGSISWQVILTHNTHQHFVGTYTGPTAQFTPLSTHDADSYYLAQVTATDSAGVSTTETLRLDPKTVRLELATDPPVTTDLAYDGAPHAAPYVKQAAVGFETTIAAPATVKDSTGKTLVFAGWSDSGAATHDIKIPDRDVRLVASYREDATPPDTTITAGPGNVNRNRTPTFTFVANEPTSKFECRIDGGAWVACSSPYTTRQLAYGSHTFYVRAYDLVGNVDPTPAQKAFNVLVGG